MNDKNNSLKKKIFISYSHQDHICARGIARFLLRQNFDVWIDADKLIAGQNWAGNIDEAIKNAEVFIALISKNSVRRAEVLREIADALERRQKEKKYQVLFVVIGNVHTSWFVNGNRNVNERIIKHLKEVQFVQLDAKANITISKMQNLLRAIEGKIIYSDSLELTKEDHYIYESGMPEKIYDEDAENCFFRIHASDLAPSTVFPFALDNQWLPDEIMDEDSELKGEFLKYGFESEKIEEYLDDFQMKNLCLALIHSRQIIVNRASILNSHSLQRLYCDEYGYDSDEKAAFLKLLRDGSIVVFLYGDKEITPYISKLPKYSIKKSVVEEWNNLCMQIPMYCIRENWETPIDTHRQEFAKQCTTLAINSEMNNMLAECFGFNEADKKEFFTILKEIEMTVFLQTHIIGTGYRGTVEGYSRSSFYKSFIVAEKTKEHPEPVLYCIFDREKPFQKQLKKLIDVYYNSIFTNKFNCSAMIPNNIKPEDTFIQQMYLKHGGKEVGTDELEYAFSEFFKNESLLSVIEEIGDDFYLENWSLERIVSYRSGIKWREYIELLEYITNRSTNWQIDFSDIERLVEIFVASIKENSCKDRKLKRKFLPAYTFRICIGSKVLDIVCNQRARKLKKYPGIVSPQNQNSLSIQFLIGDSTSNKNRIGDSIFPPIKIFDGKTNYMGGIAYFEEICTFLTEQCDFVWTVVREA